MIYQQIKYLIWFLRKIIDHIFFFELHHHLASMWSREYRMRPLRTQFLVLRLPTSKSIVWIFVGPYLMLINNHSWFSYPWGTYSLMNWDLCMRLFYSDLRPRQVVFDQVFSYYILRKNGIQKLSEMKYHSSCSSRVVYLAIHAFGSSMTSRFNIDQILSSVLWM